MYLSWRSKESPLIPADKLVEIINANLPDTRIVDVSIPMPGEKRDCYAEFLECHLPRAQYLDLRECTTKDTDNAYMLPNREKFAEFMDKLAIGNCAKVVIYDANAKGMFSAPRAWYMFRVFGHLNTWILDGGLEAWKKCGFETASGEPVEPVFKPSPYDARIYNNELVKSLEDVKSNITDQKFLVVDARSKGRFDGKAPEPRSDIKPGRIPGSKNVFWLQFLNSKTKLFKTDQEVANVFDDAGIDPSQPMIATCGSGITACFIAMASHIIGHRDVPVYDGAWLDWYQHAPDNLKEGVPSDS